MSLNVKEQRQLLVQKKDARVLKMLQLGEKVHKELLLNGNITSDFVGDSADILGLDKEIYRCSKSLADATQNQGKCTQCQTAISNDVKFCGHCGQLNPFFVDVTAPKKQCTICEEQIGADMQFCPCCGTAQGGF